MHGHHVCVVIFMYRYKLRSNYYLNKNTRHVILVGKSAPNVAAQPAECRWCPELAFVDPVYFCEYKSIRPGFFLGVSADGSLSKAKGSKQRSGR